MQKGYKKKIGIVIFFLAFVLVSLPLVSGASVNDFVKLDINDKNVYTHKDIVGSDFIVGSDKIYYGSNTGQVTVKLYLKDKKGSGDYRIGLRTRNKNITIKRVGVGKSPAPVLSAASKSYDYPNLISLDSKLTEVIVEIEFDPLEIGTLEEFDVVLMDASSVELVRYDPFLGGFEFRQVVNIRSSTISLDADVTEDHAILVHIPKTNLNFWSNETFGTGNGITFTQSDGTTEYDFNAVQNGFDATADDANYFVKVTETFPSATDLNIFLYYKGADVDNSDGTAAYPSDYNAVWHLEEPNGNAFDSTSNGVTLTHNNTPSLDAAAQVQRGVTYAQGTSENSSNGTFLDGTVGDVTYSVWFNPTGLYDNGGASEQFISKVNAGAGVSEPVRFGFRGGTGSIRWLIQNGNTPFCDSSKISWAADTWFQAVATRNSTTGDMNLYINGATADGCSVAGDVGVAPAGTASDFRIAGESSGSEFFDGTFDTIKVIDRAISLDEVKLLYTSENDSLISFGSQEIDAIAASFIFALDNPALDPDAGINDINVTLTDTSTEQTETITDWNYFIDTVQFFHSTVEGNTDRIFDTVGDFNVSLIITGNLGSQSQQDQTVSITEVVQDIDINFSFNSFTSAQADVNFGATFTGVANAFSWGFPQDLNQTTVNAKKTYISAGEKEVCVTIANVADVNTTKCEDFIVGRVIVKKPLDVSTLAELTPFSMVSSANPAQSFSGLNADTNFFLFSDANYSTLITVDHNSDYFTTSKVFDFTSASNDFTYQPYLLALNDGTTVKFVIQNGIREGLQGIRVEIFQTVGGNSVLVQNGVSDITGSILFFLESNVVYTLNFFDSAGTLLFETDNYTVTTAESFFYFNLDLSEVITPSATGINVEFNPSTQYVLASVSNLTQTISGAGVNHAVIEFYQWINGEVDGDKNVLLTISQLCDTTCSNTTVISSLNMDGNFNLFIDVNVLSDSNSFVTSFVKSYSVSGLSSISASDLFVNARADFGCSTDPFDPCPLTTIVSIVISLFIIGGLIFRFNFVSPPGIAVLFMMLLGLFAYVGWFYWVVYALLTIVILIGIVGRSVAK